MPRQFGDTGEYAGAGTGAGPALIKPLPQAATGAIDPRGFMDNQFEQFKGQYRQTFQRLKRQHGGDIESFSRAVAGLDAQADQYEAQYSNTVAQIDYIQGLVDSGYDADAGRRAMEQAAGIRVPAERERREDTFSVGQYNAHVNLAEEAGARTIKDPLGFIRKSKRKHAVPEKLLDEYLSYIAKIRYNQMSKQERIQADLAFDEGMGADPKTASAWKKLVRENPKLKSLRTYDPGLMKEVAKKVLGPVSPIAKAMVPKSTAKRFIGARAGMTYPYTAPRDATEEQAPIRQRNKRTGQVRISYDGGQTWQIE